MKPAPRHEARAATHAEAPKPPALPASASDLDDALAAERAALKALFPLPPPGRRSARGAAEAPRTRAAGALALAAVALLGGGLYWLDPAYRSEQYASAVGERRGIQLADGSRIDLNAATRIDVSWHLRSRRVVLHDGQALFAVAPASYRPFEVQAGDTHIRVVGTVFDVRKNADTVVVSVLEGRVRVGTSQRTPTLLGAAEGIASVHGELGPARHIDPQAATAWRSGRLVFERTPLAEALRDIQRYRDAPIRLHGERLAGLELSGVFDSARIDQLLDLLPTVLPLSLTRQPDGSVDLAAR